jgi:acyl-CoA synthetase (AMP-forming)/AMP-acid ligase II
MTIIHSRFPDVTIRDETITERLFRALEGQGDAPVVVDGLTDQTLTARQLVDGIKAFAGGLMARGYGAGAVVAIMAPNTPDYAIAYHGPLWAGGTVTTINPTYTVDEVAHQLRDSRAAVLITAPGFVEVARKACAAAGVSEVVVFGHAPGATSFADMMGAPVERQVPVDLARHIAALPYSSGTTGLSKGVMLTHRNLVTNIAQAQPMYDIAPGDWVVAFLPFFHIYGQALIMNMFLCSGGRVVTMPRFDLEVYLRLIAAYRTPQVYVVPPVALALAKHPAVDGHDLSCVRKVMSAAAPLSGEMAQAVADRIGCQVVQGYGMTELSPISHLTPLGRGRPGAVGLTVPNTECRIVDPDTLEDVPLGEVWVRGPQVMAGYLNNPDATARSITPDGWMRTGDLGRFDAEGYLFIEDRLKELIKVKGFQVPPAEVEAALLTHPGIADAAVRGWPDDEAGEVPVAYVVPLAGAALSDLDIAAYLRDRLATYKQPRRVVMLEAIPKSPSGKILRRLLPQAV